VSVGGGGLICGLIEGLIKNNWINHDIKIVAVETEGCDCFNKSAKEKKLVTLEKITRYNTFYYLIYLKGWNFQMLILNLL
jgi:L-serine/L-threonine ammonia-lyase